MPGLRRQPTPPSRRAVLTAVAATLLSAACAGPALPPGVWLRLPLDADPSLPAGRRAAGESWQLVGGLVVPGHLDRDAVLVAQGRGALRPLAGLRWAEPLRDTLPRLLRADLGRLLGTTVFNGPLPAAAGPARQLRVTLLALDLSEDSRVLQVRAQWSIGMAAAVSLPTVQQAAWPVPVAVADADGIALAHRRAVAELAQRIVATVAR